MDENDVSLRISQLAVKFLQRARTETALLHQLIESAHCGDAVTTDKVEHLAHKLHGSGMTFGFLAVGKCAAEIEHLMEEFRLHISSTEAPMEPDLQQRLLECTRRLAREIEAAAAR
jgi:chemotaxis protein histidine kinase CheA